MSRWRRRAFLQSSAGLTVATGLGAVGEELMAQNASPRQATIDTHIHVVNPRIPGVPEKGTPDGTRFDAPLPELAASIRKEMNAAGITQALCMPRWKTGDDDPLGVNETLRIAEQVPGLHAIGIADPTRIDPDHLDRVEAVLRTGRVKAFKAYLGYLHYGPDSPNYRPYYELAARHNIPFVFHTGDTYSHLAKVKYAHPLLVDEVAVDYPGVRFVMAHLGSPWTIDAAEILYKNNKAERANVWTDLSGFLVGSAEQFRVYKKQGMLDEVIGVIRKAFSYAERPDRFLYASDWPLAPMASYRDLIREAIPAEHHQAVFHDNARALFGL